MFFRGSRLDHQNGILQETAEGRKLYQKCIKYVISEDWNNVFFLSKYFLNPFISSNFVLENFLEQEFNKKILKNFKKIITKKLKLKNKTLSYQVF